MTRGTRDGLAGVLGLALAAATAATLVAGPVGAGRSLPAVVTISRALPPQGSGGAEVAATGATERVVETTGCSSTASLGHAE